MAAVDPYRSFRNGKVHPRRTIYRPTSPPFPRLFGAIGVSAYWACRTNLTKYGSKTVF